MKSVVLVCAVFNENVGAINCEPCFAALLAFKKLHFYGSP